MSARSLLIIVLSIWLFLTLARQAFDLVGRLWIPVGFNLLQIVCCIIGLFGACQRRLSLLVALAVSNLFSLAQNVLVCLWYAGVLGDRTRPILSGGLPYSFSFFLRYSPGCESHFDLARSRWVQSSCLLPFYHIETAQAAVHATLAVVTLILTILTICERRKAKMVPKSIPPSVYSQVNRGKLPQAPSSINDISSGYMNSSYEDVSEIRREPLPIPRQVEEPPIALPRSYERKTRKTRPTSMPQQPIDHYSSAETEEITRPREDFYTKPQKPKKSAMKASGRFAKAAEQQRRATVHEAPSGSEDMDSPIRTQSGNMTSLVSFNPKSGTLLRVREHADSDDEDTGPGYSRMGKEMAVDVGTVYERIREKTNSARQETVPLAESRARNASQDSVPSMLAPVLVSPSVITGSIDSGLPGSSCDWPPPPARLLPKQMQKIPQESELFSPGIRLSQQLDPESARSRESSRLYQMSPGIRLTSQMSGASSGDYRSAFQIQPRDTRVVGHYHAANEFRLTDEPDSPTSIPVITGHGLLV